jgi:hypothetical protein
MIESWSRAAGKLVDVMKMWEDRRDIPQYIVGGDVVLRY